MLAENLKRLRGAAGFSQDQLAGMMGVEQARISEIENRHNTSPRLDTLRLLAEALGVSLGKLLEGENVSMTTNPP